jgi:hypothetical protein
MEVGITKRTTISSLGTRVDPEIKLKLPEMTLVHSAAAALRSMAFLFSIVLS